MDLRRPALICLIATLAATVLPVWNMSRGMGAWNDAGQWWNMLVSAFEILCSPLLPAFYYALYRNEGTLRLEPLVKRLALVAALALAAFIITSFYDLGTRMTAAGSGTVLAPTRSSWTLGDLSVVLTGIWNLATIYLLWAILVHPNIKASGDGSVSKMVVVTAKIIVIIRGIEVGLSLVWLLLTPFLYWKYRNLAQHAGVVPRPYAPMLGGAVRVVLSETSLLIVPLIVWIAISRQREEDQIVREFD
jgi:hypothetical protein